ncbi:MAG TPA: PAS domain-containing protein [Gammaproteobacteria bacterium]|nr:PAS domain-containing protein [Gammaproteobacteria bacterium]
MTEPARVTPSQAPFATQGEMAALVRAHDWSGTPLGPPESWPQALRTCVDLILDSPLPNLVCWGQQLICIYNDAYRPLLGAKHDALGKPLLEVWSEVREAIEPLITKAWNGESSRCEQIPFTLLRNGSPESTWFTFAVSPLRDETGIIAGMLNSGIEVTSSVLAEEARQRRYDALLSAIPDLAYIFDLDHRFIYANRATLAMWGRTWDEAIGKNCLELGYPDWHAAMHDREIDEVVATRQPVKGEVPFNGTNGRRVYEYILVPILDPGGEVEAVGGTTRDVTDRKRSEEHDNFLVALTDTLREVTSSSAIMETASRMLGSHLGVGRCGYGEVDKSEELFTVRRDWTDGNMLTLAGTVRIRDFGESVARDYRMGKTVRVKDPQTDARTRGAEEAYAEAGDVRSGIGVPLIRHDRLVAIFYVHQTAPRAWSDEEVALVEEVADRTWEAVERARAEKALRRSEQLQRLAIEAGEIGTWDLNLESGESTISAQMAKLMEFGARPMRIPASRWENVVETADRRNMMARLAECARTRQSFEMEFQARLPHGGHRWLYSRATIADDHGKPHAYGATIDVSERKRSEADLQSASRAKDEFLAMLGHELRNPLAPIVTALQLMRMQNPHVLTRERGIIESQVQHMIGLVDDLLDVSRIARGKIELKKAPVDLGEIVAKSLETASPLIEKYEQAVHTEVNDRLVVEGDARRLVQVITNLLTNAAKYSPPQREIQLAACAEGDQAVLTVRDEGVGIDPDLLPRVFDLFTQSAQSLARSEGGLGLGLSLVRNLVMLHGGSVEAFSEGHNRGSEFVVRLPLLQGRPAEAVATLAAQAGPQMPTPETTRGQVKVLIVDDYVDAADSIAELLGLDGFETRVAYDGAAALGAAKEFLPTVALIDIGLPAMDGYEVARRMRQVTGLEKITLVAMTGYGQESDRRRAREAGFNEHLVKPLDPTIIGHLIESFAKKHIDDKSGQ